MVLWKLIIILASLIVLFLLLSPPHPSIESFTRLSGAGSGSSATSGSSASFGDEFCTRGCGTGYYVRVAKCYDKATGTVVSDSLCNATPKPISTTVTCNTDPCSWLVDTTSDCSTTCGTGTKITTYKCSSETPSDCDGLELPAGSVLTNGVPVKTESCFNQKGCSWVSTPFTNCSTTCGTGTKKMTYSCSSGNTSDCVGLPIPADAPANTVLVDGVPVDTESCSDHSGCSWNVSAYGSCIPDTSGETCTTKATQSRSVTCVSGNDEDCLATDSPAGTKPITSEACSITSGCSWVADPFPACTSCGESQTVTQHCNTTDPALASSCGGAAPIPTASLSRTCNAKITNLCSWGAIPAVPVKWTPDSVGSVTLTANTSAGQPYTYIDTFTPVPTDLRQLHFTSTGLIADRGNFWAFYTPENNTIYLVSTTSSQSITNGTCSISGNTMTLIFPYMQRKPFNLNFTDLGRTGTLPS